MLTDAERHALTDQGREMDEATRARLQKMKEQITSGEKPKERYAEHMERWKNPDGKTYNGVRMLAELSGLSEAEIRWTFDRMKHLLQVEKKSKAEAKSIVAEEVKRRPWLDPS